MKFYPRHSTMQLAWNSAVPSGRLPQKEAAEIQNGLLKKIGQRLNISFSLPQQIEDYLITWNFRGRSAGREHEYLRGCSRKCYFTLLFQRSLTLPQQKPPFWTARRPRGRGSSWPSKISWSHTCRRGRRNLRSGVFFLRKKKNKTRQLEYLSPHWTPGHLWFFESLLLILGARVVFPRCFPQTSKP